LFKWELNEEAKEEEGTMSEKSTLLVIISI
jgi:hypothetical protein